MNDISYHPVLSTISSSLREIVHAISTDPSYWRDQAQKVVDEFLNDLQEVRKHHPEDAGDTFALHVALEDANYSSAPNSGQVFVDELTGPDHTIWLIKVYYCCPGVISWFVPTAMEVAETAWWVEAVEEGIETAARERGFEVGF